MEKGLEKGQQKGYGPKLNGLQKGSGPKKDHIIGLGP
jgi:hypothetical protein